MFVSYNEDLPFTDLNEFNRKMAKSLIDYNTILPHTSLEYKTPVEYGYNEGQKIAVCCRRGHLFAVFYKNMLKLQTA